MYQDNYDNLYFRLYKLQSPPGKVHKHRKRNVARFSRCWSHLKPLKGLYPLSVLIVWSSKLRGQQKTSTRLLLKSLMDSKATMTTVLYARNPQVVYKFRVYSGGLTVILPNRTTPAAKRSDPFSKFSK